MHNTGLFETTLKNRQRDVRRLRNNCAKIKSNHDIQTWYRIVFIFQQISWLAVCAVHMKWDYIAARQMCQLRWKNERPLCRQTHRMSVLSMHKICFGRHAEGVEESRATAFHRCTAQTRFANGDRKVFIISNFDFRFYGLGLYFFVYRPTYCIQIS